MGWRTAARMRRASAWESVCGSRLCLGSRIFFKQRPVQAQRISVEELDTVMAGLEAAARVPLTNIQQISPDLFLGQQLRRPIVMLRQRPDRLEVDLLGCGRQAGQLHVLNHANTER